MHVHKLCTRLWRCDSVMAQVKYVCSRHICCTGEIPGREGKTQKWTLKRVERRILIWHIKGKVIFSLWFAVWVDAIFSDKKRVMLSALSLLWSSASSVTCTRTKELVTFVWEENKSVCMWPYSIMATPWKQQTVSRVQLWLHQLIFYR